MNISAISLVKGSESAAISDGFVTLSSLWTPFLHL